MNTEPEKGTETEQKTPTPEEQLVTLQAELDKERGERTKLVQFAEEKEKGFKSLQRELSERDKKLSSFSALHEEIQATREDQKLLAAYVASLAGRTEDDFEQAKGNKDALLKQLEEKEKQRTVVKQQKELQERAESIRQRVESLGYTPDTEEYHEIRNLVRNGDFEYAELKVKKIEEKRNVGNKEPETKPESKETEEQRIERLAKAMYQKMLEDKGLLTSDAGTPSQGVSSYAEAAKKYAAGEISSEEFKKHRT